MNDFLWVTLAYWFGIAAGWWLRSLWEKVS